MHILKSPCLTPPIFEIPKPTMPEIANYAKLNANPYKVK